MGTKRNDLDLDSLERKIRKAIDEIEIDQKELMSTMMSALKEVEEAKRRAMIERCETCGAKTIGIENVELVSRISPDGTRIEPADGNDLSWLKSSRLNLNCLSITNKTYIASGFHTYVVRLKPDKKVD